MKASKQRKMQRAIIKNKAERKSEIQRITDASEKTASNYKRKPFNLKFYWPSL